MPLSNTTRTAVLWKAAEVLGQRLGWFVIGMVLARLVAPEAFGLIALLMAFNLLAMLFVDSGFSSALIQKQDITYTDECSVFWFNLLVGSLAALSMVALASWLAGFFGYPVLEPLAWLMAANLWIQAWNSVPAALLAKQLKFKPQMQAALTGTGVGGVVAIYLAWRGWGVWALGMQVLIATIVRTIVLWLLNRWRPALKFNLERMRELFSFGSFIFLSGLLGLISAQLHAVLIGRYYSAADLGYYNRATTTRELLQGVMSTIYSSVAFPLFSGYAQDTARLRESMRQSMLVMVAINLPAMAGLLVTADALVPTLFGDQWMPSVRYVQVLCLAGMLWPMQTANLNVFKAQGRSRLFFRMGLIKNSLMIAVVLLTAQISILAIAWGMVGVSLASFLINAYYSGRLLDYGAASQLRDVAPYMALTVVMAAVVFGAGILLEDLDTGWRALVQVLIGITVYLTAVVALKMEAVTYARDFLKREEHGHAPVQP